MKGEGGRGKGEGGRRKGEEKGLSLMGIIKQQIFLGVCLMVFDQMPNLVFLYILFSGSEA